MMTEPLVSILIPCWGCERFIGDAIRSALNQTYRRIELIVVEDAGSDGTYEAACEIKDPRLRVLRNSTNLGQYRNKNQCLKYATGDLIKFLDGDDVLEPACVETLVGAWRAAGPGVGVVFGGFEIIDMEGKLIEKTRRWGVSGRCSGKAVFREVMSRKEAGSHFGNVSSHLFDRSSLDAVGGFPNDHSWAGDWEVFLKLLCVSDPVFVEATVAKYRIQSGSVGRTTPVETAIRDIILMVERLMVWFQSLPTTPSVLRSERAVREWKVWENGSHILAHWMRRLRGLENGYDKIVNIYREMGLENELRRYVRFGAAKYVRMTLRHKLRRILRMRSDPALLEASRVQSSGRRQPKLTWVDQESSESTDERSSKLHA